MTAMIPEERVSLGRPSRDLTFAYCGDTGGNIIRSMSMFGTDCNTHLDGCWGFFVVRTAYGHGITNDRITAAMQRLEDAANNIISCWRQDSEWDNCDDIDDYARSRYHSVLVQDPSLAGATIPEARRFFQKWATSWCPVNQDDETKFDRSARFRAFILLDEQVLANIETFPAQGDLDAFDDLHLHPTTQWVKFIDADNQDLYGGQVAVSAYDLANAFRQLAMEEHGLETFPRNTDFSEAQPGWELFEE